MTVTDLNAMRRSFGLLDFEADKTAVISGHRMERYVAVPGLLVLVGVTSRCEVQVRTIIDRMSRLLQTLPTRPHRHQPHLLLPSKASTS